MKSLFDPKPFDEGFPMAITEDPASFSPAAEAPVVMKIFEAEADEGDFSSGREPVCYSIRDGHELRMFVSAPYVEGMPEDELPVLPMVIYIQGSGFHRQNIMKNVPHIPAFAARGFVVAIIEVTPSETQPFPAAVEDAKAAIRAAKKNAEKLRIDPEKIILWGDSSGAACTVLTALSGDGVCDSAYDGGTSCSVAAAIDYYAPTDLYRMAENSGPVDHGSADSAMGWFIGRKPVLENEEAARAASAVSYISAGRSTPPMLIMHGDMDMVVPFEQSAMLYEKMLAAGKNVEFYKVPGAGHSTAEFWSKGTLDFVERFIRKHI